MNSSISSAHSTLVRMVKVTFGILALTLAFFFVDTAATAHPADAPRSAKGHVVVQFGDHDLAARAINFTAPISGLRALELTGFPLVTATYSWGTAVCSIGGVGCPASDCFCGGSTFWGYKYWDGSAWQDYAVGADSSTVNDGAVEGWRWGAWGSAMQPARPVTSAVQALDWLRPRQSQTDGGFGNDGATAEAQLAIGANHYASSEWQRQAGAPSLLGYQMAYASRFAGQGASAAGKLAVAQMGAYAPCWTYNTRQPAYYYDAGTGAYSTEAGPHAWAMLGTVALSETVPAQAVQYLKNLQQSNGGWEWSPTWGTDTNTTALALQALVATGESVSSAAITNGLAYLKSTQNADGGFPYDPASPWGNASDADSTAYVIQAILAAGQDPTASAWQMGGNDPYSFLLSLQLADGSFEWQSGSGSNQLATVQSVVALLGRPFPLRVARVDSCLVYHFPIIRRQ
ncbi:MAG: prenyltransferase/squalene oxidase repeat-containing protein [Chloroflexota bacterium]